jgi:hypothetical protein
MFSELESRPFIGRSRELGALRRALDAPQASLLLVTGVAGVGKTRTVRQAVGSYLAVYHRAPPVPEPFQRAALARSIQEALGARAPDPAPAGSSHPEGSGGDVPSWDRIFSGLEASAPERRPVVLVVDDAHRWDESRARFREALATSLARARRRGLPLHVVLVAPEPPAQVLRDESPAVELTLHPLPFRAAIAFLPGDRAQERLRAWAVFGGTPGNLVHVDPGASLTTNLRKLVLAPDAPLADAPLALLERSFQNPTRYAAILSALASGEGDWAKVQAGVSDLSASGQAAPYLKRLEEVGLVEARRSLDASPSTRSRRYRIRDPFTAFWFRFILPHRQRFADGTAEALHADVVRPGLEAHAASLLPVACRDFMAHDAIEVLGANARECGSLWGAGYDIPVAGTLSTGAPFYGVPVRAGGGGEALQGLDAQVRETRYGFGRERRLRLLFTQDEAPLALQREVARRHDAAVIGLDALAGLGG